MSAETHNQAGWTVAPAIEPFLRLDLIGKSQIFCETLQLIKRIATVDATVLIQGETGTGKELAARAIHYLSQRREGPFIPLNCGALPDALIESELFGHERGAFTDAKQASRGLVAQAEGGTLFFDEVEAMTPRAQVVLLRFLQDHQYRPVGGRLISKSNLRILASTNVDLEELVRRGEFRRDLLYRFRVLSVVMPPLSLRGADVLLLAEHFINRFAAQYGRMPRQLHAETARWMMDYAWLGNVRELENLILSEFLLTDGDTLKIPPPDGGMQAHSKDGSEFDQDFKSAKARAVAEFEKTYLNHLLIKTRGNISWAARLSHKDRSALNKLVKKHGLTGEFFRTPSV
jgi:DNA-binding NtrC family response regulator